jgi:hypothetical protein
MKKIQLDVSEVLCQYYLDRAIEKINVLIDATEPVKIGSINFDDLNDASAGVTTIDIAFSNAKPADKYVVQIIYLNTEGFSSYTAGYTENSIVSVAQVANTVPVDISDIGAMIPNNLLDDITIRVTLAEDNLQDWLTGNIDVYTLFAEIPTLV